MPPPYQVSVSLGGKKLIPAPLVRFVRTTQRSADDTVRRRGWKIVVTGKVSATSGSPDYDGNFWTASGYPPDPGPSFNAIDRRVLNVRNKLKALTDLFDAEGQWLEINPNGNAPIKAMLRPSQVVYQEGLWTDVVDFSVEAEASCVYFGDYDPDADACRQGRADNAPEESWSLEPGDEFGRAYKLVHTVSASAQKRFNDDGTVLADGWKVARAMVLGKDDPDNPTLAGEASPGTGLASLLGFQQQYLTAAGVLDLGSGYAPYNYVRNAQTDHANGRYSVTETWVCADNSASSMTGLTAGKALEELTVDTRYGLESGLYSVTVQGAVTGLEERHPTTHALQTTRWANADARFTAVQAAPSTILSLAETYSGQTLNPTPVSKTVAKNKLTGTVQWSYAYDTRPGVSNAAYLTEDVTADIEHAADVFARIGVVNRPAGPVLQSIGSTTEKAVTITAEIKVRAAYGEPLPTAPAFNPLPVALNVIGSPSQIFLASDRERFNDRRGSYSRTTTYVYQ
jgi:hypothetical protein